MKRYLFLTAILCLSCLLHAGNAAKNGNFENGMTSWGRTLHNQDFASIELEKADVAEGTTSLRLQLNEKPEVYICASQFVPLKPVYRHVRGSFMYKTPQGGGVFFFYLTSPRATSMCIRPST